MNFEQGKKNYPDRIVESGRDSQEQFPTVEISDFFTIELTGGAFRGFVTSRSEKQFHDFVVDKRAFWDSQLSKTVLISVETSALGTLTSEYRAFEIKFAKSSITGEPLDEASFILRPASPEMPSAQFRSHARDLHKALREAIDDKQAHLDSSVVRGFLEANTQPILLLGSVTSAETQHFADAEARSSGGESASTASEPLPESERKGD
jgi:hypothetical protein